MSWFSGKLLTPFYIWLLTTICLHGLCIKSVAAQESIGDSTLEAQPRAPRETPRNETKTALDQYVATPDPAYEWTIVHRSKQPGVTTYVVDLKSQNWLTSQEVNRTLWQHWLVVVKPDHVTSKTSLMYIGGGSNRGQMPRQANDITLKLALATGTVVSELQMIPNQPLIFHDDGQPRVEDDLIGYTWDQFLKTGDTRWPARLPMVKSVVRAMDTVVEMTKDDAGVQQFVVAGGSKRGWTTWMTAAVDKRVKAIAPIVIDVLNVDLSMHHHYSAYGFWAPAIGDYVHHKIPHRRFTERYAELLKLVDPFAYRDRFTMPKCIINATGDQFFLPDSSKFYFDELPGEKHLCYVPNSDHGLDGTDALDTLAAFHWCIAHDKPRPSLDWSYPDAQSIEIQSEPRPKEVWLWQATNNSERDFRVDTIGRAYESRPVEHNAEGRYVARVTQPEKGWTAYFVQAVYDVGAPTPLRLTTPVRVTPNALPFAHIEAPVLEASETTVGGE